MERRRTLINLSPRPSDGRRKKFGYQVVDLSLPSGTLWATCNVGATTETEYGNYYLYGKGSQTYKPNDSTYTGKENPLDSSKDTATVVMGSNFHMPTLQEMNELINNTTYSYTTINGIRGGKFTSKTNSDAYVFFPAGGEYIVNGGFYGYGTYGYYMGSNFVDNNMMGGSKNELVISTSTYATYSGIGRAILVRGVTSVGVI